MWSYKVSSFQTMESCKIFVMAARLTHVFEALWYFQLLNHVSQKMLEISFSKYHCFMSWWPWPFGLKTKRGHINEWSRKLWGHPSVIMSHHMKFHC